MSKEELQKLLQKQRGAVAEGGVASWITG